MLKRRRNEEDLIEYHDTEESLELERNLVHLPQITSALHGYVMVLTESIFLFLNPQVVLVAILRLLHPSILYVQKYA